MQFSKRTQYGLRAMICLAHAYEHGFLQTRELSHREKLPAKFLESILSSLTRARFLTSKIGATGGYRLARPPKDILISDLVARLDGEPPPRDRPAPPTDSHARPGEIGVRLLHSRLSNALRDVLANTTLAELADQVAAQTGGQMYYI